MPILCIQDLTHCFGGLKAVNNFNLELNESELVGLIGPNGAGKTTIFNLVSGFYRPTHGKIIFKNNNISGLRPCMVTSYGISRTFQNIRLWKSMTVFENLCVSQHYSLGYGFIHAIFRTKNYLINEKRIFKIAEELMEILGISKYANDYPDNLPYGLQRRVEIGRALSIKPGLLMLDEPAAGMNPTEIQQLIELIKWIREKFSITIWLIEHQMKVVNSLCDRVNVLDFGKTIAFGPPEDVRQDPKVIKAYLGD